MPSESSYQQEGERALLSSAQKQSKQHWQTFNLLIKAGVWTESRDSSAVSVGKQAAVGFPSRTGNALLSYTATVCAHVCASTETCAHGCVCIWRPETIPGVFLNHSLPSFLRQDRSLTPRLDWLSSELQESRNPWVSALGLQMHVPMPRFPRECLGI